VDPIPLKSVAGKVIKALMQAALILLITLTLAEAVLRLYQHVSPSFIFYSDSYSRYRGKPFADDWDFKLNSLGFKDTEFGPKRPDVYRIAAIGDSFAFGVVPYRYNYLTILEELLGGESRRKGGVEVLNLGIPGIGPKEYLTLFVNEVLALEPDMLLLSLFIGNDFLESKRDWWTHSYLATLIHYVLTLQEEFEGRVIHGAGPYCDDCPGFDLDAYLAIAQARSAHYLSADTSFPPSLLAALHYLELMQTICTDRGIPLLVAIIPDELQINAELESQLRRKYYPGVPDEGWDITRPNRLLASELERLGIDFLDLYPAFKTLPQQRLYRLRDSHWNIPGNRLAAETIAEAIDALLTSQRKE